MADWSWLRGVPIVGDFMDATNPTRSARPDIGTDAIYGGESAARTDANQFRTDYANAGYTGAGIRPEERVTAPTIQRSVIDPAALVSAPFEAITQGYTAAGPVRTDRAVAQAVDTPVVGPAAQAGPVSVGGAVIDQGPQSQARGLQLSAVQALQDQAAGKGPSQAGAVLQQGMRTTAAEALGAASAATGAERASARLEAANAIARGGTDAAIEAARLKAAEQQAGVQGLSAAALGIRGQDIGLGTSQAQLTQQQQTVQAQIDAALASGNAAEANRLRGLQAQLGLQAQTGNADRQLSATGANINAQLASGLDFTGRTDASGRFLAQGMNDRNARVADRGLTAGITNANAINTRAGAQAGLNQGVNLAQGNLDYGALTGNADRALTRDQVASGEQRADYLAGENVKQGYGGLLNSATGLQINAATAGAASQADEERIARGQDVQDAQRRAAGRQAITDTVGRAGAAYATGGTSEVARASGGAATSDDDLKRDKRTISGSSAKALLDGLAGKGKTGRYVEGVEDEGANEHAWFSVEDLEKAGPLGAKFLRTTPEGHKGVDYQGLTNAMLAALLLERKNEKRRAA